ncbi:hypothetical protein SLE2022_079990 [Rubroshorea leprosula]
MVIPRASSKPDRWKRCCNWIYVPLLIQEVHSYPKHRAFQSSPYLSSYVIGFDGGLRRSRSPSCRLSEMPQTRSLLDALHEMG